MLAATFEIKLNFGECHLNTPFLFAAIIYFMFYISFTLFSQNFSPHSFHNPSFLHASRSF